MKLVATTDHQEIKRWAQTHNGAPSIIDQPEAGKDTVGIRINFLGTTDESFLAEGK